MTEAEKLQINAQLQGIENQLRATSAIAKAIPPVLLFQLRQSEVRIRRELTLQGWAFPTLEPGVPPTKQRGVHLSSAGNVINRVRFGCRHWSGVASRLKSVSIDFRCGGDIVVTQEKFLKPNIHLNY